MADHPIRVLVVDDSAFVRFTISKHFDEAPGIKVVGVARDGREALDLIPRARPDVITLDVEMPRLDGLSTLREIMARHPLPVVMVSSRTMEGAQETMQALAWGAVDFVAKPASRASITAAMDEIIAKVRVAAQARVNGGLPPALSVEQERPRAKTPRPVKAGDKVVVIGASTGGPRALTTVLSELPSDLKAAVLIVQHMPAGFTRSLAERLDSVSPLSVKEAARGDALESGRALVAPGGFHMALDGEGRIDLNQTSHVHGVRPSVDVTMASVVRRFGASTVGVVLTGMGRDGAHGARLIRDAGGSVVAEAESSCVVWGMPRSVAEAGAASEVVALPGVAEAIVKAAQS